MNAEGWRVCNPYGAMFTPEERRCFELYVNANGTLAEEDKQGV